jgi:hypothetical protein
LEIKFIPEVRAFVIKELFSDEECSEILDEQISLIPRYGIPQITGTAVNKKKLPLKRNKGIFLKQNVKFITVKHTLKILNKEFIDTLCSFDPLYEKMKTCSISNTLISYYKDGDYYAAHTDQSSFTVIHYILKQPIGFSGGELLLYYKDNDINNVSIPAENNMTVIFPSNTPHRVNKVFVNDSRNGYGRFSVTNFVIEG